MGFPRFAVPGRLLNNPTWRYGIPYNGNPLNIPILHVSECRSRSLQVTYGGLHSSAIIPEHSERSVTIAAQPPTVFRSFVVVIPLDWTWYAARLTFRRYVTFSSQVSRPVHFTHALSTKVATTPMIRIPVGCSMFKAHTSTIPQIIISQGVSWTCLSEIRSIPSSFGTPACLPHL